MTARALVLLLALVSLAWTPAAPTKARGCLVAGLLPDPSCTPGAVATTDSAVICRTSTKGRRMVSRHTCRRIFAVYGISPHQLPGAYELDHLIPLELGGSNAFANLWPEAASGFHDKDQVENTLHARVCSGGMSLVDAQRAIATDWRTAATR